MYGVGCQFIVERLDFPRACAVNSVYYSTVYLTREQQSHQQGYHPLCEVTPIETIQAAHDQLGFVSLKPFWVLHQWDKQHPWGLLMKLLHPSLFISVSLFLPIQTSFFLPPTLRTEPSLTLNLCFCITGLVCVLLLFLFSSLLSLLGPLLSLSSFPCSRNRNSKFLQVTSIKTVLQKGERERRCVFVCVLGVLCTAQFHLKLWLWKPSVFPLNICLRCWVWQTDRGTLGE